MAKAGKNKELTEQQIKCAELLAKGENKVKIAEIVGINRKTITSWLSWDNFNAELDRQVTMLKSHVNDKISMNIEPMMERLIKIALKSDSDKTSLDAIIYACNRICGTPTSKLEVTDTNKDSANDIDIDAMLDDIDFVVDAIDVVEVEDTN